MQKQIKNIESHRVHVTFNSKEDNRILLPILNQVPYRLYYFTAYIKNTGQKEEHMDYFRKNITVLKEKIPSIEII
ncbi:MAG: hypothetical protein ACTSUT_16590, partial [Promethearchaeota archaeon]